MHRTFIESEGFSKKIDKIGNPSLLSAIQNEILKNPKAGSIVQGLGGVRKTRIADLQRGKGKRGGFRVIYLDLPEKQKTYLLWLYGKHESEDISADEKKVIRSLVSHLKQEG